ncbi:Transmembrane ascorbate ferrireductase 1 [Phytophthora cinnamomi]|uniref:Transmembrane ascorbate ferrireductase 1 n=1 Tax=Phytophthora cinnamomi TaxID=4785 RepID=UPI00355A5884|nr:Transmembrane ascorbate ferrireductase 1 [Phytophthora cinnamomi]
MKLSLRDAVTPASMTPLLSSIDRINAALEAAVAQPPPPTGTLRVCHATEDEWNAFADSEGQIVRLNYLEWFADTGQSVLPIQSITVRQPYILLKCYAGLGLDQRK